MSPAKALACGIDFGTSNSTVALATDAGPRIVRADLDGADIAPSLIYVHRAGRRLAGAEAEKTFFTTGHERTACLECSLAPYGISECLQYRRRGGCNDARLLWAVKRDLAKPAFSGTNSWATDFPPGDLVSVVIGHLRRRAEAEAGGPLRRAVLGHPVRFPDATDEPGSQPAALERLIDAARRAGFEEIELLPEPTAAALAGAEAADALAVTLDFGGGTFDVAVTDFRRSSGPVLALAGAPVGGERLDEVLFEIAVADRLGLHALPNWMFDELRSLNKVMLAMADPGLPGLLARIGGRAAANARAILYGGRAFDFYKAIEAAKVRLSSQEGTRIQFEHEGLRLDAPVTRQAFETAIKPEMDLVEGAIRDGLDRAAVRPEDVHVALLTGGSSQLPAFRARVAQVLPQSAVQVRSDAFTTVVRGLALQAQALWGSAVTAC